MKKLMILLLCALSFSAIDAQTIKLGSIAPESTPWGQGLNRLAAQWSQITGGRVRLQVFHGGVAGDETDSVRKMRLGQLQAATITTAGLAAIVPEFWGISLPGVIRSSQELDYILSEMDGTFGEVFRENGYEILAWSNAGWMHLFTADPVLVPDDLDGMKIASGDLVEDLNIMMRGMGLQPVPLSSPEILSGLNSGLIESVFYAPLGVAGFQWFAIADNMLDVPIAPFFGAIVIDSRSWNRIPAQYHEELRQAAQDIGSSITGELMRLQEEALELMQEYGLQIQETSAAQKQEWDRIFARELENLTSRAFRNPLTDEAMDALERYRENQ